MSSEPVTPPHVLRQVLDYDPKTGRFSWARPQRSWFTREEYWQAFCGSAEGREPFNCEHSQGYVWGWLGEGMVLAHRAAWAYCHDAWPEHAIDHINHDRTDNRLQNLRDVAHQTNMKNQGLRSNNTSGVVGVSWDKDRKKWVAQIALPGRRVRHLGRYKKFEDAVRARKAGEAEFGFHQNHGKTIEDLK